MKLAMNWEAMPHWRYGSSGEVAPPVCVCIDTGNGWAYLSGHPDVLCGSVVLLPIWPFVWLQGKWDTMQITAECQKAGSILAWGRGSVLMYSKNLLQIKTFDIVSQQWKDAVGWFSPPRKTKTDWSYVVVVIMPGDDVVTNGARSSADMALALFILQYFFLP